jgi:arsenate reductase (thioredoxin)
VKTIIFACIPNAGRSQMAAAFFNKLADPAKARYLPVQRLGTGSIRRSLPVMQEEGI